MKGPRNFRKRLHIGPGNRRSVHHQRLLDEIWIDRRKIYAIEIVKKSFTESQKMTHMIKKLHENLTAENFEERNNSNVRKRFISRNLLK